MSESEKTPRFAIILLTTICARALVDSTGSYYVSNVLVLIGAFMVPVIMLRVDESYGGLPNR